jgi:phosphotransferase system IIA component
LWKHKSQSDVLIFISFGIDTRENEGKTFAKVEKVKENEEFVEENKQTI